MPTYWLLETDLSDQTPEIPGGVQYGLVDEANPAPKDAVLFEGNDALERVVKQADAIAMRQADKAASADFGFGDDAPKVPPGQVEKLSSHE